MTLLSVNYFCLSLSGGWKPISWTGWKSICYRVFTSIVLFDLFSFILSGVIDVFQSDIESTESLFDIVSLLLSLIIDTMKFLCALYYRNIIIDIEKRLEDKFLKLESQEEQAIYQRYSRIVRNLTTYYTAFFAFVLIWYTFMRATIMDPPHTLPSRGWFPYNYSSSGFYTITAVCQLFAVESAAMIELSFDPLLPCILYFTCAHISILKFRFNVILNKLEKFDLNVDSDDKINKIQAEKNMIGKWVDYHIEILSLVDTINSVFSKITFVQYFMSASVPCIVLCLMAQSSIDSVTFIGNLCYILVMYIEIFVQCIAADRMTSEFANIASEVGTANWFTLSNNSQKGMVIILANSMKPVVFKSGLFLDLSLESFAKVLKLSYTVYNLLQ